MGTAQADPEYGVSRVRVDGVPQELDWSQLLPKAWQLGVSAVDTATAYRKAHEAIVSSNWHGEIHTKVSSANALREVRDSLAQLRREELELVYFHDSGVLNFPQLARDRLILDLLEEGVRHLGISVYSLEEFELALKIPLITHIQIPLNPLDQRFLKRHISDAVDSGKIVHARSIFLQGTLTRLQQSFLDGAGTELRKAVQVFHETCQSWGVQPLEACLSFIRSISGISGIVFGVDSSSDLEAIVGTWEGLDYQSSVDLDFSTLANGSINVVDPRTWRNHTAF